LEFVSEKYKKYLVFVEIILELSVESGNDFPEDSLINGDIFLIASLDPWYGDILVYPQTLKFPSSSCQDEHRKICHQVRNYLIIYDTLYLRGVDFIICCCLAHEEENLVLNECHTGACGGQFSRLETAYKVLRDGYF
jgi:hypothetical protein